MQVLPPPEGLDEDEIATEAGLRAAIEREALKLQEARKTKKKISPDTVRLITFLAGSIRRRIENLSPEEKQELQLIRERAEEREIERKTDEITQCVEDFIAAVNDPKTAVRFSEMNELEDRVNSIMRALGVAPEKYAEFLEKMNATLKDLEDVKNKGNMFKGFEEF